MKRFCRSEGTRTAALAAAVGLGLAQLAGLAGCAGPDADPAEGYSARPLHRTDVRSVFVEMFTRDKKEFRRDFEFRLTEAVAKRIESDTDYKIARRGSADTILRGEILEVDYNVLSEIGADVTRETQVTLRAAFTWQDLRTGEILAQEDDLRAAGEYTPRIGEDEFRGTQAVVEKLARRIVEKMEGAW